MKRYNLFTLVLILVLVFNLSHYSNFYCGVLDAHSLISMYSYPSWYGHVFSVVDRFEI